MPMGMGSSKQLRSLTGRRALYQGRQQVPNIPRMSGLGSRQATGQSASSSAELEMPQVPRMLTGMESDGLDTTPAHPETARSVLAGKIMGHTGKVPFRGWSALNLTGLSGITDQVGGAIAHKYRVQDELAGPEGNLFRGPADPAYERWLGDPNTPVTPEQSKMGLGNFIKAIQKSEATALSGARQLGEWGAGIDKARLEANQQREPTHLVSISDIPLAGESDVDPDQMEMDYNYEEDEYGD